MKRSIYHKLEDWKNTKERKPLVLKGARQVGKTWALHAFGKSQYMGQGYNYHYIDLKESRDFHSIFMETFDPAKIVKLLEFRLRKKLDTSNDLLVLDEIQECPNAITALKYFQQDLKELDLIVAGSHLGL
ncbi:MAG: AAA family ATPase, partial [Planctomycetota bacterium]